MGKKGKVTRKLNIIPSNSGNTDTPKHSSPKPSLITEISQKPYYIIITLLLTIFGALGGIPGIIQWIEYQHKKPVFNFKSETYLDGVMEDSIKKTHQTFIMLTGILLNEGENNLFPNYFKAAFVDKDGNIKEELINIVPPKNFVAHFGKSPSVGYDSVNDLQQIRIVTHQEPIYGSFMFGTKFYKEQLLNLIENEEISVKLSCVEVDGKETTINVELPKHIPDSIHIEMPKHGIHTLPQ